ncbi:DEHA2F24970p [Debaryomyces hansenii CBS767]|uniref:DEHA2F24970p n=1 Tax=Debaryomyces hansenii (strain ATCC 36239 / CBS 767 / BCRC 21394 / JCM 1990 / NBRC 0083 / IGC 2968) TaxID=284592 RepID=Q6BK46_DEBHA|nr:DEHA2F24970p [Debaryomyces hansenii CBS767]CAG89840.1 DEHA2F24970p [Debaryomyces hansenii CBS767]|eukprot:XP_461425.1 DEHA2F24970p [Debaryomyces hansenii CBS767]
MAPSRVPPYHLDAIDLIDATTLRIHDPGFYLLMVMTISPRFVLCISYRYIPI